MSAQRLIEARHRNLYTDRPSRVPPRAPTDRAGAAARPGVVAQRSDALPAPGPSRTDIDDFLGPAAGRFFGAGYKRVAQRITDLCWDADPALGAGLQAVGHAAVTYPDDWSRKRGAARLAPHLSSVDALAVSARLVEALLLHGHGLEPGQVSRAWLRRYVMTSSARPQLDLDAVELRASTMESGRSALTPGWHSTRFDCRVGAIRVRCEVEHEPGSAVVPKPVPGAALAPPVAPYHAGGYRDRSYRITDVAVDPTDRCASASVRIDPAAPEAAGGGVAELAAAHQPSVTMLDALIVFAQLAQALLYELDSLSRADTNTLWMRKIDMWRDGPRQPLDPPLPCVTHIDRSNIVTLGGARWRASNMAGEFGGIRVRYALGHELPDRSMP